YDPANHGGTSQLIIRSKPGFDFTIRVDIRISKDDRSEQDGRRPTSRATCVTRQRTAGAWLQRSLCERRRGGQLFRASEQDWHEDRDHWVKERRRGRRHRKLPGSASAQRKRPRG